MVNDVEVKIDLLSVVFARGAMYMVADCIGLPPTSNVSASVTGSMARGRYACNDHRYEGSFKYRNNRSQSMKGPSPSSLLVVIVCRWILFTTLVLQCYLVWFN